MFKKSPTRWADDVIRFNRAMGHQLFPIDVKKVAKEYSQNFFPDEPIIQVHGDKISGTEGVMLPVPGEGWAILYNADLTPKGRINFTIAHEFGHYLLHRHKKRNQFRHKNKSVEWQDKTTEKEADRFAVNLLMPLFDFQDQIGPQDTVNLEKLISCAERYGVSLTAAIRRWLEYTEKRAVMVIVVEGRILWSLTSRRSFTTHAYIQPIEESNKIPKNSLAANPGKVENALVGMKIPDGTWLTKEKGVLEMVSFSDQDDSAISLLILRDFPEDEVVDQEAYNLSQREEDNLTKAELTNNSLSSWLPSNNPSSNDCSQESQFGSHSQEVFYDDHSQESYYADFANEFNYEECSQEIEYGDIQNDPHSDEISQESHHEEYSQEPQYEEHSQEPQYDELLQEHNYGDSACEPFYDEYSQVPPQKSKIINHKVKRKTRIISRSKYSRKVA